MKFHLVLLVLTIGFGCSLGHRPLHSHVSKESNLIRPCDLHDMECMRRFLATNSNCIIKRAAPRDPLHVPRLEAKLATFNTSILMRNFTFYGLSTSQIVEFGQSKTTGNLVIALLFKRRYAEFLGSLIFHRRAQESFVITDMMTSDAKSVTVTAIIPRVPHLRLQGAEIHYYAERTDAKLTGGPNFRNIRDQQIRNRFTAIVNDLPSAFLQELETTPAPMMTAFIQESLCDFGDRSVYYYYFD